MSTYLHDLDHDRLPNHVGIVMDGNGRWARLRGLPRIEGHAAGEQAMWDTVVGANELGLGWLTMFAFSTENWNRPKAEVAFLMGFNHGLLRRRRDRLPPDERAGACRTPRLAGAALGPEGDGDAPRSSLGTTPA